MAGTQHRAIRGIINAVSQSKGSQMLSSSPRDLVALVSSQSGYNYRSMIQSDDTYTHLRTLYNAIFLNK